jgi:hypothetical protein
VQLGWISSTAAAATGHRFHKSIGAGAFSVPTGEAVNQQTGDLYVADGGEHNTVDVMSETGGPPSTGVPATIEGFDFGNEPAGVAVDNTCFYHKVSGAACETLDPSDGDVYVANVLESVIDKLELNTVSHEYERVAMFPFPEVNGVAVDHDGNVYVADIFEEAITVFNAKGKEIAKLAQHTVPNPMFVAVDSTGHVYVSDFQGGTAKLTLNAKDEITSEALLEETAEVGRAVTVAADGNVLVDEQASIVDFSAEGQFESTFAAEGAGALGRSLGVTTNTVTQDVFATDTLAKDVNVYTAAVVPTARAEPASPVEATTATLNGVINPVGITPTECVFEYGPTARYGKTVPCTPSELGSGVTPVPVSAPVTDLNSGTPYHFRLRAANANGDLESKGLTFTTAGARIDGESALAPTASTVRLSAAINPLGTDTTVTFEYGPTNAYGSSAPSTPIDVGSGTEDAGAGVTLRGLSPSTTYHYRVVAIGSVRVTGDDQTFATEPAGCENQAFRVGPSANLPDCRAYEQVTPVDKGDSEDMFGSEESQANNHARSTTNEGYVSANGERFLLNADSGFGSNPNGGHNQYVFSRTPEGWTMTSLTPPDFHGLTENVPLFNAELTNFGIRTAATGAVNPEPDATFAVGPAGGPYTTVFEGTNPFTNFVGMASHASKVLLQSTDHSLAPGASALVEGSQALYEDSGGALRLVNVLDNGELVSPCGAQLGFASDGGNARNAISEDGSKVFFIAPDPRAESLEPSCYQSSKPLVNPPHLYMRENGETTIDVSAPEAGVNDPTGFHPVQFVGAASDGSKVFFITPTQLTADDGDHDPELYEYNTTTKTLTRISHGETGNADGDVRFVGTISADGSAVYFTAFGKLATGAPALSHEGAEVNAYRYDTQTGDTKFIATVSTEDFQNDQPNRYFIEWETGLDVHANWYSTADGRYLAFASHLNLTKFDAHGFSEVYRYDSVTGGLTCVSCNPAGAVPTGDALLTRSALGQNNPGGGPPRTISENGDFVFFDTSESLVPQDVNGRIDVYEWHDGALALISGGTSPEDSFFLDSSASGRDVFFGTHQALVAGDRDVAGDLYDARIGGGFGTPPESAQCSGEDCQAPLSASPPLANSTTELVPAGDQSTQKTGGTGSKTAKLTRQRKLKRVLATCRRLPKHRRHACKLAAKRRYGGKAAVKGAKKAGPRIPTAARRRHS